MTTTISAAQGSAAERVSLVEVGVRDGLQNESAYIPTEVKLALIDRLVAAGLQTIEATAFVSPKWVPQMADHEAVLSALVEKSYDGINFPVLVPNLHGLHRAMANGVGEIAIFIAASESFSQKNTNCSIAESLNRIAAVCDEAQSARIRVRAYISCVLGCPYEGSVAAPVVAQLSESLMAMGCYQVSLGDTIGVGTPAGLERLLEVVTHKVPIHLLAGHFHDTWGMATANVMRAYQLGMRCFDASVAGLGGCPYAKGASGNVATEALVYLFDGLNVASGIDSNKLIDAGQFILGHLGRTPQSNVMRASLARRQSEKNEKIN